MAFSYRTRQRFRRLWAALLTLMLIAVLVLVCWVLWLDRYVVYTRDGVKFDFSLSPQYPDGVLAVPPTPQETVDVYYQEFTQPTEPENKELQHLSGFYVTLDMLRIHGFDAVKAKIQQLPAGTAVMVDVKDIKGEFYYSSSIGHLADDMPIAPMDDLITFLQSGNYYTIARLPAFRDYWFGLYNVPMGLPKVGGLGSLWADTSDNSYCYWLSPAADGVIHRLAQITLELRTRGFDEVLFYDFRYPDTDQVIVTVDKTEALKKAAADLVNACTTDRFTVSFTSTEPNFPMPEGRCRLYMDNVDAEDIVYLRDKLLFTNPEVRWVFLADSNDTRYADYGILRPMPIP